MKPKDSKSGVPYHNPNQDLIDGCKRREQQSQFMVYKLYYKAIYNISLRMVRDETEAEDIMQESFLSAFDRIYTYSGVASFGAWLRKIVENRSYDFLRKKNRIVFESIETSAVNRQPAESSTEEEDNKSGMVKRAREIINNLPAGCRDVISLYHFEGYDHEKIGEILSISPVTSRSQYNRSRKRILDEFCNSDILNTLKRHFF
ncbi:MAG TPA: sigma-70 family RNA polymerase sigma factor [Bacteroidales bacterium]|nr:sigma-70 family RNA polymerase sigma factor [Bacteroidales bacterium]